MCPRTGWSLAIRPATRGTSAAAPAASPMYAKNRAGARELQRAPQARLRASTQDGARYAARSNSPHELSIDTPACKRIVFRGRLITGTREGRISCQLSITLRVEYPLLPGGHP